ncbi:MAG TPA: menaquinone biosynthesis decarboxylase [Planctomycetota bacterium]|nr:menaquinone biosynthesis decarboxylase [Planctomycetota bacterium]
MKQPDLRSFLSELRAAGELLEIDREADPDLEIAAIADRASRAGAGNKALLFTRVRGSHFPVLINAFGSERRMNLVCRVERREQLEHLLADFLAQLETPRRTLREKLAALPLLSRLGKLPPRIRPTGPCQDVVHEGEHVDLMELPILRTWPDDAGPVITLPLVFTRDPESGARNCGMYRLQRYDKNTLAFHVHTHHTGAEHLRRYAALGQKRMPVAVAVGASPAAVFSAVCPLPPGVDEMLFAAFLQGGPVDMVRCRSVPLFVPAAAEFVIEGWVDVDERRREGPFGDHTGFYSLADDYPVLHVTALTHRKNPIWHATVVGPPPQEDCWMGAAIERLFLPLQKKLMPELIDMRLPFAGVFHNLMLLKIRKDYPGQARKVAHTVWGLGQAMFTKVIVVLDEDGPDLRDDTAVLRLLLERLDAARDLEFVLGPTETLDHASRALHFGGKVALDLTRALPGEGERAPALRAAADAPPPAAGADEVRAELLRLPGVADGRVLLDALTVVAVEKVRPAVPRVTIEQVWRLGERNGWTAFTDRVLVVDADQPLDDPARLLWLTVANIDPERDLERCGDPHQDASLRHRPGWNGRRLGVDATRKNAADGFTRDWPTEQVFPDRLLNKIANHWRDLGFPGEMP